MKTGTQPQFVKITSKGKVSIKLEGVMRQDFLACLEQMLQWTESSNKGALNMGNVEERTRFALVSEIYTRHFTTFNLLRGDIKMLLTMPQALAFWQLSQEYEFHTFGTLATLMMQLHQKLS